MATDVEILARLITNKVLTIDAGAGRNIGDLTNNDASGSIYNSWLKICEPLVPWINTHGSGSSGSGSVWGLITGNLEDQTDLYNELTLLSGSIVNRELLSNKSSNTNLGTSDTLYPTQNAVKVYVDSNIQASSSITTASNIGTGEGEVYKQKVGDVLQFKTIKAGSNIILTNNPDEVLITAVSGGVMATGSAIWGQIIGSLSSQSDLYGYLTTLSGSIVTEQNNRINNDSNLQSQITVISGSLINKENISNKSSNTNLGTSDTLYPTQNAVKVYVDNIAFSSGSISSGSNLGSGEGIYSNTSGSILQFKSLKAGNNIILSSDSNEITINSTGSVIGAQNIGDGEGDVYSLISGSVIQLKTIKAGDDIVVVDTEDTVEIHKLKEDILNRLLTVSSSSIFSPSSTLYTDVAELTSTSAVMIYTTGTYPTYEGKVKICMIESGSIITGPEYTFASGSLTTGMACKVTDNSMIVSYKDTTAGEKLKILDFNALTITAAGEAYSIGEGLSNEGIKRLADNKCILVSCDEPRSSTTQIICRIITTTPGKTIVFSEGFAYTDFYPHIIYLDIDSYTYGKFSLSYRSGIGPYEGNVVLGEVVGDSIIFYPSFTVNYSNFGMSAQTMLNSSEAILMWSDVLASTVWACILKIKNNTITSGSVVAVGAITGGDIRTINVHNLSTNTFISTYVTFGGTTNFNIGVLQSGLPIFNTPRILTDNSLSSNISLFGQDRAIVVYRDGTSPQTGKYVLVEYSIQDVRYIQNIGTGTGQVFKLVDNKIAYLKTLSAGSGISITNNVDEIVISSSSSIAYTPENISNKSTDVNLGTSDTLYPTQNAVKTYVDTNIQASSSITTALNLGSGIGLYEQKVGNNLQFKSLKAGSNITLSSSSTEITINSTASGSLGTGSSLPSGGNIHQVITKSGVNDYSTSWEYPPGMIIYGNKTNLTINGSESINNYFNVNLSTSSVFSLVGLSTKTPYTFLINNVGQEAITIDYPQEYVVDLAPADIITISTGSSKEVTVIYNGVKRIWRIGEELREVNKYNGLLLYVGGGFTSPTSYFTVINKTTKQIDTGWPSFSGGINTVVQDGSMVYVGGQFALYPNPYFTVIDKTTKATGSSWPSFDGDVYSILQGSTYLYLGGNFTSPTSYFTVINKTTKQIDTGWPNFDAGIEGQDQDYDYLYLGGNFTSPTTRFAVINKTTKQIDTGWPSFISPVSRVAVDDTYIYLGTYVPASGTFFTVINKTTKQIDTGWPSFNGNIVGMFSTATHLYIGGQFTSPTTRFAVINKTTKQIDTGWPSFDDQVSYILVDGLQVYVGGSFTSPTTRFTVIDKTTKATGSSWPSFSGDLNNIFFIG